MRYYYRDFGNGNKRRYTNGEFVGWTKPTGLMRVPYAQFKRKATMLFVPLYSVPKETLDVIGRPDWTPETAEGETE